MTKYTPYEVLELVAEEGIIDWDKSSADWWFGQNESGEYEFWTYEDGKDGEDTAQRFAVDFSVHEIRKEYWS